MGFAVLLTLPGLVILLTVVAFADQLVLRAGRAGLLPWRNSATTASTAYGHEYRDKAHGVATQATSSEAKRRTDAMRSSGLSMYAPWAPMTGHSPRRGRNTAR